MTILGTIGFVICISILVLGYKLWRYWVATPAQAAAADAAKGYALAAFTWVEAHYPQNTYVQKLELFFSKAQEISAEVNQFTMPPEVKALLLGWYGEFTQHKSIQAPADSAAAQVAK